MHACKKTNGRANSTGKPIRFHYADVRDGVIHSGTDEKTKLFIRGLHQLNSVQKDKQIRPRHIRVLLEVLQKADQLDVDFFFKMSKIDKQLSKFDKRYIGVAQIFRRLHWRPAATTRTRVSQAGLVRYRRESAAATNVILRRQDVGCWERHLPVVRHLHTRGEFCGMICNA